MRLISNEELLYISGGSNADLSEGEEDDGSDSPDGSSKKNTAKTNPDKNAGSGNTSSGVTCTDKVSTVTSERTIKTVEFGWSGVKIEYQGGETKKETTTECTGPKPKDSNDQKKNP